MASLYNLRSLDASTANEARAKARQLLDQRKRPDSVAVDVAASSDKVTTAARPGRGKQEDCTCLSSLVSCLPRCCIPWFCEDVGADSSSLSPSSARPTAEAAIGVAASTALPSPPPRPRLSAHSHLCVGGRQFEQRRSALLRLVRDDGVHAKLERARPDSTRCGYMLRPLRSAKGATDAEHVMECQMLSHVLAAARNDEMRALMRAVVPNEQLRHQPAVVEAAFRAIYDVHNGIGNLLWTSHELNMWKKTCVGNTLGALDEPHKLVDSSFANMLYAQVVRLHPEVDDGEASAVANAIARNMRTCADDYYVPHLHDVQPAAVVQNRVQRREMYTELADDFNALIDVMRL